VSAATEIYPSFASALAACGVGYDDGEVADVVAFRTAVPVDALQLVPEQAINSILAVGIAAAELSHRPLRVLDFGGGCGFHYFQTAAAVRTPLHWAIVETPIMAERAAKLGNGRFDVFIDIAAGASALGSVDLVHASGAIPYVRNPLATLQTLAALRPRYFLLARFPSWGRAQIVSTQVAHLSENGIGPMPPNIADRQIKYPITFVDFQDMLRVMDNYEIASAIDSPSGEYEFRGQKIPGRSIIFRSKDVSPP